LTIRQATELVNSVPGAKPISERQMRRRLYHLHAEARAHGGVRILKRASRRRVLVSAEALLHELRTDTSRHEALLSDIESETERLDRQMTSFRHSLRSIKRRLKAIRFGRWA